MRHSTTSSISFFSAISHRSRVSPVARMSWWCTHRFRPRQSPNLLPMRKPIRARSTLDRLALAPWPTWPPNCSRSWRKSYGPCALSRRGTRTDRPDRRTGAGVFSTTPPAIEHIRAGKLRALAVTSAVRSEVLPELPTIGDFLPGYEATFMVGLGGPKNVPAEIIDRLNREINAALAEPRIKARLADLGTVPLPMASTDFGKLLAEETEKWGKVIRAANIKAE